MTTWTISDRAPRRYTTKELLFLVRHAKAHPLDSYQVSWTSNLTASQVLTWFMDCLQTKINATLPTPTRKMTDQYQRDLHTDRQIIEDRLFRRIRRSGRNILRTRELARRYPEINTSTDD